MSTARKQRPINHEDNAYVLAIELNVPEAHVKVEKVKGEKYYVVAREPNIICEGMMLYFESKKVKVQRVSLKNKPVYLLPINEIKEYFDYYGSRRDTITDQNRYVCLYDCFTQLLQRHLAADEYEFQGRYLNISREMQDADFLTALFDDEDFVEAVFEYDGGFSIDFEVMKDFKLVEIDALFELLSMTGERIAWRSENFTTSSLCDRLNFLPVDGENALTYLYLKGSKVNEALIRIPFEYLSCKILIGYLDSKQIPYTKIGEFAYLRRSVVVKLFPYINQCQFEMDALKFIDDQMTVVTKLRATNELDCDYANGCLIVYEMESKRKSIPMGVFKLDVIEPKMVELLISVSLKLIIIKRTLIQCQNRFDLKYKNFQLIVTTAVKSRALTMISQGNIERLGDNMIRYSITMEQAGDVTEEIVNQLDKEVQIIIYKEQCRRELTQLLSVVTVGKIDVKVDEAAIVMHVPRAIVGVLQPLTDYLQAEYDQDSYRVSYEVFDDFIRGEWRDRLMEAVHVYNDMYEFHLLAKKRLGARWEEAIGPDIFKHDIQTLYKALDAIAEQVKREHEIKCQAKVVALPRVPEEKKDEERIIKQKPKKNNATKAAVEKKKVKAGAKSKSKSAKTKKPKSTDVIVAKALSASPPAVCQASPKIERIAERDSLGVAEQYDYNPAIHQASVSQLSLFPAAPRRTVVVLSPEEICDDIHGAIRFVEPWCRDINGIYDALINISSKKDMTMRELYHLPECVQYLKPYNFLANINDIVDHVETMQLKRLNIQKFLSADVAAVVKLCRESFDMPLTREVLQGLSLAITAISKCPSFTK